MQIHEPKSYTESKISAISQAVFSTPEDQKQYPAVVHFSLCYASTTSCMAMLRNRSGNWSNLKEKTTSVELPKQSSKCRSTSNCSGSNKLQE